MRRFCAFVLLVFVSGCGSSSFLGGRYDDFTAFYNTFYNAERAFDRGEKATKERAGAVDREIYRLVFPLYENPSTSKDFEEAIRKSADVLRDHGSSKWVDDALLLIGKSYFYQQNYFAAQEKFREVVELGTRREDEARYWLARTLLASASYDALSNHLVETFDREKTSKKWAPYLRLAQGELYVRQGLMEEAVEPLKSGAKSIKNRALSSRAHYLLGQINESLGNYADAVDAYKRAQRKNPDFDLVYAAQVSVIRSESASGNLEQTIRDLRKMERDDKNFDQVTDLRALRGLALADNGDVENAIDVFHDILRSTDRTTAEVKGGIHYRLAKIYRDTYEDFELAAAHFDTASTSLQVLIDRRALDGQKFGFSDPFVPWAIRDAREQKETFGTFAKVAAEVAEMDSLLYLGSLDEDAYEIKIAEIRRKRREELSALAKQQQQRQIEEQFRNGGGAGADVRGDGLASGKNVGGPAAQRQSDANESGFLYHKDPASVQDGFRNFVARWGERPAVPGWRLSSKLLASSSAASGVPDKRLASAKRVAGNLVGSESFGVEFDDVDVGRVPRTEEERDAMRSKRAEARYQVGTVLFLSMNRPDSAAAWFRKVITDDPDEAIAPKAYYALAEVNRALGDSSKADELLAAIKEKYPNYGEADGGKHKAEQIKAATATAEVKYASLYREWQNEQYPTAAAGLLALAEVGQPTPVGPQALFAAGSVMMDWARHDGRSLLEPVELPLTDSVAVWLGLDLAHPEIPVDSNAVAAAANQAVSPVTAVAVPKVGVIDSSDVRLAVEMDSTTVSAAAVTDAIAVSDGVVADSTTVGEAVVIDSIAVGEVIVADSIAAVVVDSMGVSEAVVGDSTAVRIAVSADSPGAARAVLGDSLSVRSLPGAAEASGLTTFRITLEEVLNTLSKRFSNTPYMDLAKHQLKLIGELKAEAQAYADSVALAEAAIADSLALVEAAIADSVALAEAANADSLALAAGVVRDSSAVYPASTDLPATDSLATDSLATDSLATESVLRDSTAALPVAPVEAFAKVDSTMGDPGLDSTPVPVIAVPADSVYLAALLDSVPEAIGGEDAIRNAVKAVADKMTAVGSVQLEFVVGKDGVTRDVEVVVSHNPQIDAVATRSVLGTRFSPGRKSGVPVDSKVGMRIDFGEE